MLQKKVAEFGCSVCKKWELREGRRKLLEGDRYRIFNLYTTRMDVSFDSTCYLRISNLMLTPLLIWRRLQWGIMLLFHRIIFKGNIVYWCEYQWGIWMNAKNWTGIMTGHRLLTVELIPVRLSLFIGKTWQDKRSYHVNLLCRCL